MVESSIPSNKLRQIYNFERVIEVDSVRSTTIDIYDNVVVLGNSKGYIAPYEQ